MKMKKLIAMLLTVAMTAALFVGCGEKPEQKPDDKPSTDVETPDDGDKEETDKTLADFNPVKELNIFCSSTGITDEELNAEKMHSVIEEMTGYKFTMTQTPATEGETALMNVFILEQDYQLVYCNKDQFNVLLQSGALYDITELVGLTENMKDCISQASWDTVTKDGSIYGIPQAGAVICNAWSLAYRLDWLNEYNEANPDAQIAIPSEENGFSMSISNFKKMLEFFATKVPESGAAFAMGNSEVAIQTICPAFGIYQKWYEVEGELKYYIEQPGYEDYMKFMNELYNEGLAYYQKTSQDTNALSMMQAGETGVCSAAHWNCFAIETVNCTDADGDPNQYTNDAIGYIMGLVDDAHEGDASAVRTWSDKDYYYWVVPAHMTPEKAAGAIDYADKKMDEAVFLRTTIGTEGETYEIIDGGYFPILPAFNDECTYADKFTIGYREDDYAKYWLARTRKTSAQAKGFAAMNYNNDNCGIRTPIAMMTANETYDAYFTGANTAVFEELVLQMFNKGAEVNLDAVIAVWQANNGDEITAAVNEWYSNWALKDTYNTVGPVK